MMNDIQSSNYNGPNNDNTINMPLHPNNTT